jgi:hypothetical protein
MLQNVVSLVLSKGCHLGLLTRTRGSNSKFVSSGDKVFWFLVLIGDNQVSVVLGIESSTVYRE